MNNKSDNDKNNEFGNVFESNAGEVFKDVQEIEENQDNEDCDLTEYETNVESYLVLVNKNKHGKNSKTFELTVHDKNKKKTLINRTMVDLLWLRDNFKKEFPYSYVISITTRSHQFNQWISKITSFKIFLTESS